MGLISGGLITGCIFCFQVDGPITGGGVITGIFGIRSQTLLLICLNLPSLKQRNQPLFGVCLAH